MQTCIHYSLHIDHINWSNLVSVHSHSIIASGQEGIKSLALICCFGNVV